jgi:phage tail protein X
MTRRPLPTFVCYIFAMVGLGSAAWTLASVGGSLPVQAQQPAVQIVVHADQILAPVNRMLFGQNFGPWMNTTPEYVEMYQDLGVSLLRFPGGNYGDENNLYPNNVDDLAALAQALDAEVSVQTRLWRAGTPEKAAELVRYANVKHNYGFRYWEIGNEPDLYMVNRRHEKGDPVFDVAWYNNQFRAFSQAMKAVDPSILIAGPVVTGGWPEWMPAFIQANGDIVDVLSWHWYAHGNEMNDEAVLATPPQIEDQVQALDDYFHAMDANLLNCTIWNYTADNTNERGDMWNDEDLSIFSRDQQTDPDNIHSGGRGLDAIVRPYPRKTAGEPVRFGFDLASRTFEFEFRPDPGVTAPTEIFVPEYQYPSGYEVTLSGGEYRIDRQEQTLLLWGTETQSTCTVRVRPARE